MLIIIDNYSVHISVENDLFVLKDDENNIRKLSALKLNGIMIYKHCTVTTAAIALAAEYNIALIIHDSFHKPVARLLSNLQPNHANVRKYQALFSESIACIGFMQQQLILKYKGQESNVAYCSNRLLNFAPLLKWKQKMESLITAQQKACPAHWQEIRVAEAHISRCYWHCLSLAMKKYMPFKGRSTQPANDAFKAMLNYGYGMLYPMVETAILAAGLDTQIGFMHANGYATPSLVFDLIEPFRCWIEKEVLELCFTKTMTEAHFESWHQGIGLSKEGKQIFIPAIVERMNEATLFQGKRMKRKDQIQWHATTLAKYLIKEYNRNA